MDFEKEFPLRYYINLGRREDRRTETEWRLEQAGITAERFPAVDSRFCKSTRGYENKGRYALALTIRMAIREARRQGAPALLLLEDDVILHPNFLELVNRIDIPADWGLFYLGCHHVERPQPVSEHLVKATHCLDSHAWAIREPYYGKIMQLLDRHGKDDPGHALASDQFVARVQHEIPTYACFPNLAWQAVEKSDLTGTEYSLYKAGGSQNIRQYACKDLLTECVAPEVVGKDAKLGLLFLTRGDVNHPKIWQQWLASNPEHTAIYSHPKYPEEIKGGFLGDTAIKGLQQTEWGHISLVRASLALLKSALENEDLTHFVLLSESCVPVKPLSEIMFRLQHDPRCQFGHHDIEHSSERFRSRARCVKGVPLECWRFHQQWWLLDRAAAKMAIRTDYTTAFEPMFAADEGYFGTVLAMEGYPVDDSVRNHDVTWTHWPENAGSPASHASLSSDHLTSILDSGAMFARKFPIEADIDNFTQHLVATNGKAPL